MPETPCLFGNQTAVFLKCSKIDCGFKTSESPALRGFVGGQRALATAAFYLVLLSNGQISGETLRNGTWPGGKIHPQRLGFPLSERYSQGLFSHRPQTPQHGAFSLPATAWLCAVSEIATERTAGESGCTALWRVSAFFGVAAPLGCAAWTLLFPQPRAFQPCCVCAYSFITGPCRCSGSSRNCCA